MSSGFTCHYACLKVGILALYHRWWKKLINKVEDVNVTDAFVSYNTHRSSCKLHQGWKSFLPTIKPQLKAFIFIYQLRDQGIQLTNRMVGQEAACLLPAFKDKTSRAKEVVVHCVTKSVGLTQCSATHTAQKHYTKTEAAA
jgi:hypothetical protein